MSTNSIILDVRHLSVDYFSESGTVHAVSDVSLHCSVARCSAWLARVAAANRRWPMRSHACCPAAEITGGQVLYYPSPRDDRVTVHKSDRATPTLTPRLRWILRLTPAQLRAVRWSELAIVFQSAMNALNQS